MLKRLAVRRVEVETWASGNQGQSHLPRRELINSTLLSPVLSAVMEVALNAACKLASNLLSLFLPLCGFELTDNKH